MDRIVARVVLALSVAAAATAAYADTTLRLSHFWPSGSAINQQLFEN